MTSLSNAIQTADVSRTPEPSARRRPQGRVAPGGAAEPLEGRRYLSAFAPILSASSPEAAGAVIATPAGPTAKPVRVDAATSTPSKKIAIPTVAKTGTAVAVGPAKRAATAALVVTPVATPAVRSFQVDDGTGQRSVVRSLTLAFNEPVTLDAGAVALIRNSDTASTPVSISML